MILSPARGPPHEILLEVGALTPSESSLKHGRLLLKGGGIAGEDLPEVAQLPRERDHLEPCRLVGLGGVSPAEAGVELRFGSQIQVDREPVVVRVGALRRHEQNQLTGAMA